MSGTLASSPKGACGLSPAAADTKTNNVQFGNTHVQHAVMAQASKLWRTGYNIKYSFVGGTPNQRAAVNDVVQEWTYYANLTITPVADGDASAEVRIGFEPNGGSWSTIGRDALIIKGPVTMNLGWIGDVNPPSVNDRGTILHEWGHALGLMHEHQSPARGGTIRLKDLAVYDYYHATQGWDNALIKSQIIDVYNTESVSNFSKLDTTSIMMYFMPGYLNEQNLDVPVNNQLSDLDKAYMVINYPRKTPHPKSPEWTLFRALHVAEVPVDDAAKILQSSDPFDIRTRFAEYNTKAMVLKNVGEQSETSPADIPQRGLQAAKSTYTAPPADVQQGLLDLIGSLTKGPLLTDVISSVLAQHGLQPVSQTASVAVPAAVQQGLFDIIGSIAKHPAFKSVVTGIVSNIVGQHGLQPVGPAVSPHTAPPPAFTQATAASPADVQQGLFSIIGSVAKHPLFQQVVTGIVEHVVTQRGLQPLTPAVPPVVPGAAATPAQVQRGLFDIIGTLTNHPAFKGVISAIVDNVVAAHGLQPVNPQLPLVPSAAVGPVGPAVVQQGLVDVIGSLAKNPVFTHIVSGIVSGVLAQRGLHQSYPSGVNTGNNVQPGVADVVNNVLAQHGLQTSNLANADVNEALQRLSTQLAAITV